MAFASHLRPSPSAAASPNHHRPHHLAALNANSPLPAAPLPQPLHRNRSFQPTVSKEFSLATNARAGEKTARKRRAASERREERLASLAAVAPGAAGSGAFSSRSLPSNARLAPPQQNKQQRVTAFGTSARIPHAPLAAPTPMMFPRQPMCDPMDLSIPSSNRVTHILFDNFANSRAGMNTGARGGSRTKLLPTGSLHVAINKLWPGHLVPSQMLEQATAAVIAERDVLALVAHGGDGTWVDFSEFLKILRVIANLNNFRSVFPSSMPKQLGADDFASCARCLGIRRPGKLFIELASTLELQDDGTSHIVEGDTVSQTTIAMWFAAQSRVVSFSRSVTARPAADSMPALRLAEERKQREDDERRKRDEAEADELRRQQEQEERRRDAEEAHLAQVRREMEEAEEQRRRQEEDAEQRRREAEEAEAAERARREKEELERQRRAEEVEAAFRRQEQEEEERRRREQEERDAAEKAEREELERRQAAAEEEERRRREKEEEEEMKREREREEQEREEQEREREAAERREQEERERAAQEEQQQLQQQPRAAEHDEEEVEEVEEFDEEEEEEEEEEEDDGRPKPPPQQQQQQQRSQFVPTTSAEFFQRPPVSLAEAETDRKKKVVDLHDGAVKLIITDAGPNGVLIDAHSESDVPLTLKFDAAASSNLILHSRTEDGQDGGAAEDMKTTCDIAAGRHLQRLFHLSVRELSAGTFMFKYNAVLTSTADDDE